MSLTGALADPLQHAFMRSGIAEILLLGVACGLVGPFILQRNLTFFSHALSHTIFPGLVLAAVFGVSPYIAAAVGALLTVVLVLQLQRRRHVGDDSAVGVVFLGLFAAGVVLVGLLHLKAPDVNAAVVGNVLGVGVTDLLVSGALVILLASVLALLYRPLVLASFDRIGAQALALPVWLLDLVVLAVVAATATVSVKVVGVILTVAVLIIPAAAARRLSSSLPRIMALSAVFVWLAGTVGLYSAYYLRVAPAAIVVLVLTSLLVAAHAIAARRAL